MKSLKTNPAFTIVELLIVIVIIGILAAITIVSFGGITGQANQAALQSDLNSNGRKLQLYFTQYGSYPTALDGNNCPTAPTADTRYCLKLSSGNTLNSYTGITDYATYTTTEFSLVLTKGAMMYEITQNTAPSKVSALVTTLAGSGFGFADGTGTAASFSLPGGVAVDSSGNVYVADTYNHRIRKITPAGVVTTLAGSGTATFANGTGVGASFNRPFGVAVDSSGNVYVAVRYDNRISKITSAGVVTTLAGSGNADFANGTGISASFNDPTGVAVDSSGNVYVADSINNRIRKITPAGVVTTLAGSEPSGSNNGTGISSKFNWPWGVSVDSSGNVYIADQSNSIIRKIQQF